MIKESIRQTIRLHKPLKMFKLSTSSSPPPQYGNGSVQPAGGGPKLGATISFIVREGFNPTSAGAIPRELTREMNKSLRGPKKGTLKKDGSYEIIFKGGTLPYVTS